MEIKGIEPEYENRYRFYGNSLSIFVRFQSGNSGHGVSVHFTLIDP